jgi:hypothetical protein
MEGKMKAWSTCVKLMNGQGYRSKDLLEIEVSEVEFTTKPFYKKVYIDHKVVEFIFQNKSDAEIFVLGFDNGGYWMADPQREWDWHINKCIDDHIRG